MSKRFILLLKTFKIFTKFLSKQTLTKLLITHQFTRLLWGNNLTIFVETLQIFSLIFVTLELQS